MDSKDPSEADNSKKTILENGTEIDSPNNVVIVKEKEYQIEYNTDLLKKEEYT